MTESLPPSVDSSSLAEWLAPSLSSAGALYLDLMKRCLVNWIYADYEHRPIRPKGLLPRVWAKYWRARGVALVSQEAVGRAARREGRDWPVFGHTMIGLKRLENLQSCLESALKDDIAGDFIEAGVWRGGATIFMRAVLKAYGVTDRTVWVADSFEGLPRPDTAKYPQDTGDQHHTFHELAVSVEEVKRNFALYGLLDEQVKFLKGWFRDTLPFAPITRLALIHLDGDMYESTMDGLVSLYPKLSPGGYLIIDDYGYNPACRQAVHDFRQSQGIGDEIRVIDWGGVYWRRCI